ncbi:MAG: FAD-dependent oxidoreductase [Candidatus Caldarchaeum sp.]|nr:FAD-dependent oxidoreductase [Candidatus Caldarchaeum sp.]
MVDLYDVAVVGGSSSGLIAAREAARKGLSTVLFEEDAIIGRPEKCAGLYSIQGIKSLGIPVDGPYLQNRVRGAVFVSPTGRTFEVDARKDVAVVFNRERMDLYIAEQAIKAGARLFVNSHVNDVRTDGEIATVKTSYNMVQSRYLIIAEGRTASNAKKIFPDYSTGKWLPIVQYQVTGHGMDPRFVYLFFRHYLREFFGYLVPVDNETGKFGVAASKFPDKYAEKLLSEVLPKARVTGMTSSSIYVGHPLRKIRRQNVMLVGDVAGQVKATTGGGVVMGGIAAQAAASHAAGMAIYENDVKPMIDELEGIYWVRKLYEKLSPKLIEPLFQAIAETGFNEVLNRLGDMDRHWATFSRTLLTPVLFRTALSTIKNMMNPSAYV